MSKLIELIKACLPVLRSQKDCEEAFLNDAVDIYDLERRMQAFDKRSGYALSGRLIAGMEGH